MCDCFHMMLPTWPEAPGSASGQQLQPEEPDAETVEDQSVTEGSVDEIIRPRPQGSSPVYEYVTEGASFGLPEDTPRRRRSWWKRDSGDSQTLSRMSRLESTQEATEGTLKTKVEAGASGYIVTGGGDQGIFVKQVLKESSAAKLFSLREGDQLLSTTIFFDDIKYEDALKILQYSEPYKVQFTIRRQLPAREDDEGASGGAQRGSRGSKKQDQDIAEGRMETPTETLQEDGDQERLISKPREGRGRQPQRERLSWPKFQALKSKRGPGPRRSHSSSEACERGDVPDLSPTSTDTEAQLPEAGPGRQQKRSFSNLRFRVGSGKGLSGRGAHGGTVQAGVLVETGPRDSGREASRAAAHGGREDRTAGVPEAAEPPTEPGLPTEGAPGEGAGPAPRPRRKTKEAKDKGETVPQGKAGLGPAPRQSREGAGEGTQALEVGIARLSLQDSADQGIHQNHQPEFHVRIPTLKTPRFGLYKEKVLEKGAVTALQRGPRQRRASAEGTEANGEEAGEAEKHRPRQPAVHPPAQEGGEMEEDAAQKRDEDRKGGGPHTDEKEGKMKMLRVKLPSFGWSPTKEAKADKATQLQETEKEKESSITVLTLETDIKGKDGLERHSKFKMPKFKMPSFGVSVPRKSVEATVEVSVPKAQSEVTLPPLQADVKTTDVSIELPSAELEVKAAEVGLKLPEGHLPEAEPTEAAAEIGLKGHLSKVQMPSIKVPKVDIKGPKLDLKDAKGEVTTPDVEVSLPSVEVDTQAAGTKLEGDVSLGDKEVAARDSKFKMPKFKMPSFGVSAPSKSVQAAMEVSVPKAQAEVTLPSVQADVKTSDLSIELPSTELDVKAVEVRVKLPEGHLPEVEPKEAVVGIGLKDHLPKLPGPSISVPQVDLKAPQVDIKGPKLYWQDAKGEVTTPNVEVSLLSMKVDTQAAGTKLESDVSLGDKELAARDSKFKMPKFKMPSFGVSAPRKSVEAALEESVPKVQAQVTLPSVQADVKTSALSIELPSAELEVKDAKMSVKLPEGHLLRAEPREVALGIALKGHLPKLQKPSIKVPKVDIKGPKLDLKDAKGEVLAKYQVTLPGAAVSPELPLEAAPCSQNDAYLPSSESSASLPTQERVAASQTDSPAGPVDPMFLVSYGRVSFPKFHPPKFGFSVPEAADAEVEASAGDCAPSLSTTGPALGLDSTAVPRSVWPSAVAAGETPAKDTERGGKDSPLKMPWIKLPSFSWSPKNGAVPPEDPERSLDDAEIGVAVDTGHKGVPPGCPVSAVEVAVDALPEKDGEESGVGSPGCAVLEHVPLTGLTPEGGPGLPRGDPAAPRSRPPAGGGAPEGADVDPHLPQAHAPLLDFARPDLRPSKAKVGVRSSAGGPPSLGHSSQGHGLRDGSASQPLGEATAPSVGDPQQLSCSPADVDAPAVESAASQGGWFRMPALRLPSLRRPAKERGAAGAREAPVPVPAASALREGESPAPVTGQGVPGSEVEEAMSLQPREVGADEAAAELASHADTDVLKRSPEDKRSEPHLSPAGAPAAGLSPSEARVHPGEDSLPLQMPSSRLSGTQAPPAGPAGPGLAAGQGRAEEWPSQPEGPIKLKASRTDGPSQVSVVSMGQPWEGSVVTVRLPRLSVPRFAFPDPSSEADVFIPAVTEVRCPGSSLAHDLHEGSPGVWGASILRAGAGTPGGQPVALGFSPEASPISEVRVHIQRAQGEGPEVAVHSRATAELADLSGPEAISTQVVRQLEIPASEIQTASYGFSLLKVKMPEPRTRVSVRDSRLRDDLQEASKQAALGAEPASGGLQPDTGGPFEAISPSVNVPRQPMFTPKMHSGHQGADSCSDKDEAAEVLAFPPKEASGEAATSLAEEDSAPREKPGGRRSGLFRFWLPNIGFSSSAEEPRADSKGEARMAAALQTQPGARPEAELPKKPQRAGWFRFPTLGLSSSPTKKSESSEDEAALAEQNPQEQAVTFFDAPESFSPEGEGAGGPAETAGARAMATSTARTGLVLQEQDPEGAMRLHPGPPPSEDRRTDERRPCEAPTVRTRVSTLIHSTESEAEVPESGGAPPSHSPPEVGPQTCRPPRASAAEAAPGLPTRPRPHAGSCAPEGLC
ncbi:protein AHNAK2-like isoform X1 [Delphinapterus leucas]|uniref:Protein AHNAK2-like isoform X1 n=2 Tax=Delphinapterus leucas TaxID=9749 RepID=A0A7F8K4U3_DELLE|nr:protein AHNAK2-like isoform X1 [Delphinapterus leucas]